MSKESLNELRDRLLRDEHAQELIRMRAFEIYTLRGGQPGGEAHDWFQAESEVIAFLIEEESSQGLDSQSPTSKNEPEATAAGTTSAQPGKPAKDVAPKPPPARKAKEESAGKKPAKRSSKKSTDSAPKPQGQKKA